MNSIKIGWSEISLVPEGKKVSLVGQFYERISDVVETPITATALALECGDQVAVFCGCDLVGTPRNLLQEVRGRILEQMPDFPVDQLMLSAIHTHTSLGFVRRSDQTSTSLSVLAELLPDTTYETLAPYQGEDLLAGEAAREFLVGKISTVCIEAWNARAEGLYATGFGRAAVGMCRRVCYDDGSAKMWGDADSPNFTHLESGNDSGVELMFTYTPDKKLTGVIANVACPAQVLEHRSFISSDYMGKLKRILREKYGESIQLLGLISPAGDQCPRDLVRWVEPETPIDDPNVERIEPKYRRQDPSMFDVKGCERVARRLATEIEYAISDVTEWIGETVLEHKTLQLDLPLRRVTPAEYEIAKKAMMDFAKEVGGGTINFADNARMHVHAGTISRFRAQKTMDVVPTEIHVIRLGDLAFATNPFELFLDYGNQIRARSKAAQTFLIQLSCGVLGYLPTREAESGSHYSAYVSSGSVGHEGGELLVRKTLTEINEMF